MDDKKYQTGSDIETCCRILDVDINEVLRESGISWATNVFPN